MLWKNEPEGRKSGARSIWSTAAVILILAACLCMSGCGTDDIDISGYHDRTITLTGLAEQDITVTIDELKAMECVTKKTESTSDKIGKVRATGPKLETLLAEHGASQTDFSHIRITAKDGYDVKLNSDVLADNDIILAFGIDGEPLDAESAPLRVIIPKSDSAYWIRMVTKIEFVK